MALIRFASSTGKNWASSGVAADEVFTRVEKATVAGMGDTNVRIHFRITVRVNMRVNVY